MPENIKALNRSIERYPLFIILVSWFVFFLPMSRRDIWNPDNSWQFRFERVITFAKTYLIPMYNSTLYSHYLPFILSMTLITSEFSAVVALRMGRISAMTNIEEITSKKWLAIGKYDFASHLNRKSCTQACLRMVITNSTIKIFCLNKNMVSGPVL